MFVCNQNYCSKRVLNINKENLEQRRHLRNFWGDLQLWGRQQLLTKCHHLRYREWLSLLSMYSASSSKCKYFPILFFFFSISPLPSSLSSPSPSPPPKFIRCLYVVDFQKDEMLSCCSLVFKKKLVSCTALCISLPPFIPTLQKCNKKS